MAFGKRLARHLGESVSRESSESPGGRQGTSPMALPSPSRHVVSPPSPSFLSGSFASVSSSSSSSPPSSSSSSDSDVATWFVHADDSTAANTPVLTTTAPTSAVEDDSDLASDDGGDPASCRAEPALVARVANTNTRPDSASTPDSDSDDCEPLSSARSCPRPRLSPGTARRRRFCQRSSSSAGQQQQQQQQQQERPAKRFAVAADIPPVIPSVEDEDNDADDEDDRDHKQDPSAADELPPWHALVQSPMSELTALGDTPSPPAHWSMSSPAPSSPSSTSSSVPSSTTGGALTPCRSHSDSPPPSPPRPQCVSYWPPRASSPPDSPIPEGASLFTPPASDSKDDGGEEKPAAETARTARTTKKAAVQEHALLTPMDVFSWDPTSCPYFHDAATDDDDDHRHGGLASANTPFMSVANATSTDTQHSNTDTQHSKYTNSPDSTDCPDYTDCPSRAVQHPGAHDKMPHALDDAAHAAAGAAAAAALSLSLNVFVAARVQAATAAGVARRSYLSTHYAFDYGAAELELTQVDGLSCRRSRRSALTGAKQLSKDSTKYLSYYEITVTVEDVRAVRQRDWLTDNNIAFWETYLEHEVLSKYPEARIHLMRPSLSQLLAILSTDEIRQQMPRFRQNRTSHIFIPVNNSRDLCEPESGSHWSLLLVSVIDGVAFHYDSLGGANIDPARRITARLANLLELNLRFRNIDDTPMQDNLSDCGVFVCILMRFLMVKRLLNAHAREKVSMSLGGKMIDADGGRKEMIKTFENLRREAERRRSTSPFVKQDVPRIE